MIWNKLEDSEKFLLKCLMVFMVIQPFLDIKYLFTDERFQLFGFTIPTLVRCLGIFIMAVLSIRFIKIDKEHIFYAIYFVLLGIYFIIHHIVAKGDMEIPSTYRYSLFNELFYFLRMIFPFIIMYITRHIRITYQQFSNVLIMSSVIIGTVIVVSNLLHISLPSYANGGDYNKLNFIEWFTEDISQYGFEALTSKGWFYMGNQISGLIMLLVPFNIYECIRKPRLFSILSTLLLMISMILLGTRIATYGFLLVSLCMILSYLFFYFIKKDHSIPFKNLSVFSIIFICIMLLFVSSPIQNRVYSYGEVDSVEVPEDKSEYKESSDPSVEEFILQNYKNYKIEKSYIFGIYSYRYDPQFWVDFFKTNTKFVLNNRDMQRLISNHISNRNDDLKYKLSGFSFTRFTSGNLYLENDFFVHYYTIGIIGILLLLGPWLYYMFMGFVTMLKNYKERFNYFNVTLLLAMGACIGCSLFSGHIMDELIITLYLGFVCGFFIKNYKGMNHEKN